MHRHAYECNMMMMNFITKATALGPQTLQDSLAFSCTDYDLVHLFCPSDTPLHVYNTKLHHNKRMLHITPNHISALSALQRSQIPGLPVTSQGSFAVKNRGRVFPGFARFA